MQNYSFLPLLIDEKIYLVNETSRMEVGKPIGATGKGHQGQTISRDLVFQGKNQKQVVIIVDHPEVEYTTIEQDLLLRNILGAMNLNYNDIALVNLAQEGNKIPMDALKLIGCKKLIGFGVNPDKLELGKRLAMNQLMEIDAIVILLSYSLNELQSNKQKKMELWRNIKTMFDL
jgi:DNA polymerase III psi subunit